MQFGVERCCCGGGTPGVTTCCTTMIPCVGGGCVVYGNGGIQFLTGKVFDSLGSLLATYDLEAVVPMFGARYWSGGGVFACGTLFGAKWGCGYGGSGIGSSALDYRLQAVYDRLFQPECHQVTPLISPDETSHCNFTPSSGAELPVTFSVPAPTVCPCAGVSGTLAFRFCIP